MILETEKLSFSYGRNAVLRDVSVQIPHGSMTAILGKNGVGKSTLLKIFDGLLPPGNGIVRIQDAELHTLSRRELARQVAYVPQQVRSTGFTVYEVVSMGRRPHIKCCMTTRDTEIIEEVLDILELSHLAHRSVRHLSGGELQKVIIARALAQEPGILLLDEPTSNLDMHNQLEVMNLIRDAVRYRGISALVSIHDVNLALQFSDHFILLKDGQVRCQCPAEELNSSLLSEIYDTELIMTEVEGCSVVLPAPSGAYMKKNKNNERKEPSVQVSFHSLVADQVS